MDDIDASAGKETPAAQSQAAEKRSDIYTHEFSSDLYAMGWSVRPDQPFRLAVGSFVDNCAENCVEIVKLDDENGRFVSQHK